MLATATIIWENQTLRCHCSMGVKPVTNGPSAPPVVDGQEIAAAGKAARLELQRYSAHLAIGLAEDISRGRMTADTQDALVREFVRDLGQPPSSRN